MDIVLLVGSLALILLAAAEDVDVLMTGVRVLRDHRAGRVE